MTTPDELCARVVPPFELTVRLLPPSADPDEDPMVLIEGDTSSLRFLADLLMAVAADDGDCGFQMSPVGAGHAHFSSAADIGIYIHRLPCTEHPL